MRNFLWKIIFWLYGFKYYPIGGGATLTKGKTFGASETVTATKLHNLVDLGSITNIVNADVSATAAIEESKLNMDGSSVVLLSDTQTITGDKTLSGTTTLSGDTTISGELTVSGATVFTGGLTAPGVHPSVFQQFGGSGAQGAGAITDDTNFSDIDDSSRAGIAQFTTLEISTTKTLTIDTGIAIIGVSGTLTITGTIDADAQGYAGGDKAANSNGEGGQGKNAENRGDTNDDIADYSGIAYTADTDLVKSDANAGLIQAALPFALSGAGGGGGASADGNGLGGCGGGAGSFGGEGGDSAGGNGSDAVVTLPAKILELTGGAGDNSILGPSQFVGLLLRFRGAGGGGGGNQSAGAGAGDGGSGGGVIYIECNELVYTGTLTADGSAGSVPTASNSGAGGGGGGGIIIIRAKTLTTNTGTTTITGGSGGASTSGGNGGDGKAGYKNIVGIE